MIFNNTKKYLLVFAAILLIGENISFSSDNCDIVINKTYVRRSKSVNPRLYQKAHYIDKYSEDSSKENYNNFRTFSEEDKNGKVRVRPHPYLIHDGPWTSYHDKFDEEEYEDYEDSVG